MQFCRPVRLAPGVNLNLIARTTSGLREADLNRLCSQAVEISVKQGAEQVRMADFSAALEWLVLTGDAPFLMSDDQRRSAAYHAAGHLLAAWLIPGAIPRYRISILPDKVEESHCCLTPILQPGIRTRTELLAGLATLLSGRAAEEIALRDNTNLAEADFRSATWLAQQIVMRWGMGSIGPLALVIQGEVQPHGWSDSTLAEADHEIRQLVEDYYQAACNILIARREQLDRLAETLMQDERVDLAVQSTILGARPDHDRFLRVPGFSPANGEA